MPASRDRDSTESGLTSMAAEEVRRAPDLPNADDSALYRHLVESATDMMYRVDLSGRITYVNPAAVRVLGHPASELVGAHFGQLVREDHRERLIQLYAHQLEERLPTTYSEFPLRGRDEREIWVGQNQQLVQGDTGLVGLQAVARDITAQRETEEALRESDERFRQLAEHVDAVFWLLDLETNSVIYASPAFDRVWGIPREKLLKDRESWLATVHPDDREALIHELPRRRLGEFEAVYRIRRGDGRIGWIRDRSFPIHGSDGQIKRVVGLAEDVTERRGVEEESLRLAALSRENPNPVLECDAVGRPLHVNPAAEHVARELGLDDVQGLLPRNHDQLIRAALDSGQAMLNAELKIGDRIFSWTYRPDAEAGVVYLFAVDITGRRLMEEQLRHDALHDSLTGLPNRLLFMERLAHSIARAKRRESYLFAVLFLDLDRFKVINDSLGHHVGDELLILVAQRLQKCLRGEDTVARFGGDEFAILLEGISGISDATRVAERIQAELSASVNLSGFEVFTSASIGIALSSSAYERPEYLLRNADMAMYRAKGFGHARFEIFDRAMHAQALARLQLETDLRRALERDEFILHYQPIISLEKGTVCGAEALIRWEHPERGLLGPDEFIPAAEETGLILPIGRWVLDEACRKARVWQERFGHEVLGYVSVNLSAKQFSQADLVEQISAALSESGVPAKALRLEITESAVMENADAAINLLARLKKLGVEISLDDFGTGYSSLSYLHRFPLDALKIDRSFVSRIDTEERGTQLVETVLTLARSLGVSAVAEGIETVNQRDVLRILGCDYGQGYHFARPLTTEGLEALLASGPSW